MSQTLDTILEAAEEAVSNLEKAKESGTLRVGSQCLYSPVLSSYLVNVKDTPESRSAFKQVLEEPSKTKPFTRMGALVYSAMQRFVANICTTSFENTLKLAVGNPQVRLYAGSGKEFKPKSDTAYVDVRIRV